MCTLKVRFRRTSQDVGFVFFSFWRTKVGVALGRPKGRALGYISLRNRDCKALPFFTSLLFAWHSVFPQLSPSLLVLLANSPLPLCCFPPLSIFWNPAPTVLCVGACMMLLCLPYSAGLCQSLRAILVSPMLLQAVPSWYPSSACHGYFWCASLSAVSITYQQQKGLVGRWSLAPPLLLSTGEAAGAAGQRIL